MSEIISLISVLPFLAVCALIVYATERGRDQ